MISSVNAVGCNDLSCLLGTPCQARLLLSWCFTSTETIRLIREGGYGGGGRGRIIHLSLHCHYQNDPCINVASDKSQFNVSLIVMDKVARQCPQTTTFLKRRVSRSGIEPRPFCLPLWLPAKHTTTRPVRYAPGEIDMYYILLHIGTQ